VTSTPEFTLVIACYNEERLLRDSVARIAAVLDSMRAGYEIVFVDDSSRDSTVSIIRDILERHPAWTLIAHPKNQGRGSAVADGIRAARAPIVGYIDIDLSTSPWYLPRLIAEVRDGADIATAMRVYKLRPRTLFRWVLSKGYRFIMRLALGCDLQDTETGCKVFNRERVLPVLDRIREMHWFWDTEIMARSYVAGYRIAEIPTIFIREGSFTTVHVVRDTLDYLGNLVKFRAELRAMRRR
jgi:glycosyltransferase involved in cell wall biosynthesis